MKANIERYKIKVDDKYKNLYDIERIVKWIIIKSIKFQHEKIIIFHSDSRNVIRKDIEFQINSMSKMVEDNGPKYVIEFFSNIISNRFKNQLEGYDIFKNNKSINADMSEIEVVFLYDKDNSVYCQSTL